MAMRLLSLPFALLWLTVVPAANALVIDRERDASVLSDAFFGAATDIDVSYATRRGQIHQHGGYSTGTFDQDSVFGLGSGIVLSTGDVGVYGAGANHNSGTSTGYGDIGTPQQNLLANEIIGTGNVAYDVTELTFVFDATTEVNSLRFDIVFGSEEWPEASGVPDGFGAFLNGELIASMTSADAGMGSFAGTELDGVWQNGFSPVLEIAAALDPFGGDNTLTFLIFDTADDLVDSTVYLANFATSPDIIASPEPGTAILLGVGLVALASRRRRA